MTRPEKGKICETAGVLTYKLAKEKLNDRLTEVIFYIGYMEGARNKLKQNGVNPDKCTIYDESEQLHAKLVELCKWED